MNVDTFRLDTRITSVDVQHRTLTGYAVGFDCLGRTASWDAATEFTWPERGVGVFRCHEGRWPWTGERVAPQKPVPGQHYPIEDLDCDKAQINYDRKLRSDKIAELQEILSSVVHDRTVRAAFRETVLHIIRGGEVATDEEKRAVIAALDIRLTVYRSEARKRKTHGTGRVTLTASVPLEIDVELNSDAANLLPTIYRG